MNKRWVWVAAAVCLGSVFDQVAAQTPGGGATAEARPVSAPARPAGYLGRDGIPDHEVFLPAPPANDSPLGIADFEVFRATRSLEGTPRWELAASDAEIGSAAVLRDFGCALGVDLSKAETPKLSRLISRASADLFPVIGDAKDFYQRPRPFVTESGPVCVTVSEQFAASGSYPSGHAATGWLYALLLTKVAPDRSAELLARGRMYGESRVVCGVHFVSDVEAGRLATSAIVAAMSGNPEFQADLAAAREEIDALRAEASAGRAAEQCSAEQAAATRPW